MGIRSNGPVLDQPEQLVCLHPLVTSTTGGSMGHEMPGTHQNRTRPDFGDQAERQALALEMIATSLSRIAAPQKPSCQVLTYEDAAIALNVSIDLLGKMVADGRLKQGRHYIKIGANVRFVSNLVELIFEDQLDLDEATLAPAAEEPQPREPTPITQVQRLKNGHQSKLSMQYQSRVASKNRAGLDFGRSGRAL